MTRVPGSSQPEMGHGRLVRAVRLQRWMATGSEPGQVYVTTHGGRQDAGEAVDEDEGCIQQQVDQHNNIAEDHPSETVTMRPTRLKYQSQLRRTPQRVQVLDTD